MHAMYACVCMHVCAADMRTSFFSTSRRKSVPMIHDKTMIQIEMPFGTVRYMYVCINADSHLKRKAYMYVCMYAVQYQTGQLRHSLQLHRVAPEKNQKYLQLVCMYVCMNNVCMYAWQLGCILLTARGK